MVNTAIIILAAGNSSRLGTAKQLLPFNGKTLLQHTIHEAIGSGAYPVLVVTGANLLAVSASIADAGVITVYNPDWQDGMASGILAGMQQLLLSDAVFSNVIISVCDQPFISAHVFKQLFEVRQTSVKGLVASSYAGAIGCPALFSDKYTDALLMLQGEQGAKTLLRLHKEDLVTIPFEKGNIDIDTMTDYERLLGQEKHP